MIDGPGVYAGSNEGGEGGREAIWTHCMRNSPMVIVQVGAQRYAGAAPRHLYIHDDVCLCVVCGPLVSSIPSIGNGEMGVEGRRVEYPIKQEPTVLSAERFHALVKLRLETYRLIDCCCL